MRNQATILVVGGDIRHPKLKQLQRACGEMAVIWLPTRESDAGPSRFLFQVVRPEVVLVVILIGLMRHQHVRDLLSLCRKRDIRWLIFRRSPEVERIATTVAQQSKTHFLRAIPLGE